MRIVEDTKVVRLGRVRGADLARLDLQFGLAKAAALDKDLICSARARLAKGLAVVGASKDWTERTTGRALFDQHRVPVLRKDTLGCHCELCVVRLSWYGMRVGCCNVLR